MSFNLCLLATDTAFTSDLNDFGTCEHDTANIIIHGVKVYLVHSSVSEMQKRGGVAKSVMLSTLIHEVMGSNPDRVILSVLPKLGGWMTGPGA